LHDEKSMLRCYSNLQQGSNECRKMCLSAPMRGTTPMQRSLKRQRHEGNRNARSHRLQSPNSFTGGSPVKQQKMKRYGSLMTSTRQTWLHAQSSPALSVQASCLWSRAQCRKRTKYLLQQEPNIQKTHQMVSGRPAVPVA